MGSTCSLYMNTCELIKPKARRYNRNDVQISIIIINKFSMMMPIIITMMTTTVMTTMTRRRRRRRKRRGRRRRKRNRFLVTQHQLRQVMLIDYVN